MTSKKSSQKKDSGRRRPSKKQSKVKPRPHGRWPPDDFGPRFELPMKGFRRQDLRVGDLVSVAWCDFVLSQTVPAEELAERGVKHFLSSCETVGRVVAVDPDVGFLVATSTQTGGTADTAVDVLSFPFSPLGEVEIIRRGASKK